MRKCCAELLGFALMCGLLGACGGGELGEGELAPLGEDEQAKIRIMFGDSHYFSQEYGQLFAAQFPHIEVEIADMLAMYDPNAGRTMEERLNRFLEEQRPDVLMLYGEQYEMLAREGGKLLPLDPVIKQDEFDTEGIHPAVLKLLREPGGGKLFGLSPEFSGSALYYNLDLFHKHGVEPPTDSMSWEEVFELAKRFPTDGDEDSRIYGFELGADSGLSGLIRTVGSSRGLGLLNPEGTEFNIDTDSWRRVFLSVLDAASSGAVHVPSRGDESLEIATIEERDQEEELFVAGRAAMTVKNSYEAQQMVQAKERRKQGGAANWGIVTAPVDPRNRNQSADFRLGSVFSVSASSENPRAAWEFVKYVNSDEFSRLKSKTMRGSLQSRTKYNSDLDGLSLEPFYKLEPKVSANDEQAKAPIGFLGTVSELIESEVEAVLSDKKTADEALKTIQERGAAEWPKARRAADPESASP
ncbi:extracellular solute-binding protein [Cohnella hongkongensis]|uniref:Extracellular solute-binding protein n=1 Tax=Cohnella hongkongensis TaxID=178337 RepID=A0ABV9FB99_9BACL